MLGLPHYFLKAETFFILLTDISYFSYFAKGQSIKIDDGLISDIGSCLIMAAEV